MIPKVELDERTLLQNELDINGFPDLSEFHEKAHDYCYKNKVVKTREEALDILATKEGYEDYEDMFVQMFRVGTQLMKELHREAS